MNSRRPEQNMPESPVWSSPVLRSVRGVIDRSRHVHTSVEAIEKVASWMAFEEFAFPSRPVDGAFSDRTDPAEIIDPNWAACSAETRTSVRREGVWWGAWS